MGKVLKESPGKTKEGQSSGTLAKTTPAGNSGVAGDYNKAGKAEGRDASKGFGGK